MTFSDLFGPITTRTQIIDDLDSFILGNNPYGEIRARNIQWGAVQFDGPLAQNMVASKAALQWHFGGVPYPITRAMRIYFSYIRSWDGSGALVSDSIMIGFPQDLAGHIFAQPVPHVAAHAPTFFTRMGFPGPFGGTSSRVWGSYAAILASEASAVVTSAAIGAGPAGAPVQPATFQALIGAQLAGDLAGALAQLMGHPTAVDFDGPAQNYDSHNVFPYTPETLFNDPEKYSQVLFWYFGGKPYRITKAMRVPLTAQVPGARPANAFAPAGGANAQLQAAHAAAATGHALFIGYTGANPGGG